MIRTAKCEEAPFGFIGVAGNPTAFPFLVPTTQSTAATLHRPHQSGVGDGTHVNTPPSLCSLVADPSLSTTGTYQVSAHVWHIIIHIYTHTFAP